MVNNDLHDQAGDDEDNEYGHFELSDSEDESDDEMEES